MQAPLGQTRAQALHRHMCLLALPLIDILLHNQLLGHLWDGRLSHEDDEIHIHTLKHKQAISHTHTQTHTHKDRHTHIQSYWVHLGNSLKHLLTTRSVAINLTKP